MDPALWEVLHGDPDEEIAAIVRLHPSATPPSSIRIIARFGDVATCRLHRGSILAVHADPAVVSLKAPKRLVAEPQAVLERPQRARARARRRPRGIDVTGRGVVIGVVDWG
jgi:hypothetical protein